MDARSTVKHTLGGTTTLDNVTQIAADYNGDGKVDTVDAREILRSNL